ncbi:16S rRNA (uracil(1498)-N(3))-methyltransferase [Lacisediminimonas profundi]|uniref:16S rRNA (uracil(1498)-N(3))-methyltransferase n=1 Tax=Lacisediminimonas profundi TaxID=2603856 RepID=UPI00124BA955|nr:16S rRNA (uracil(1498)-N(3))-methyltransferase [Lacisediminimonas profundi]
MPRFYCSFPLQTGTEIELPENISRHILVLRMRAGDEITVFNGDGGEHLAVLSEVGKRSSRALLKHFSPREAELQFAVTIAQALPEGSKMDWIIEKCVELGAAGIQPLMSQRCVVRLSGERALKRLQHWQGIVAAASEQCGRNRLAPVAEAVDFTAWTSRHDLHRRILLTPRATQSLSQWATHQPRQAVALVIGPEGGFTEAEEALAESQGMLPLSMGPRVLRTETAAMAALSTLSALWERD